METLSELIGLVKRHVSLGVSELSGFQLSVLETSHQTEAGCRILINVILLRVVSAMSTDETDVNIIPEFPITKTTFPSNLSFDGMVDLLLTKLPSRFTREITIFSYDLAISHYFSGYLLLDPTSALGNPEAIDEPMTTSIFEAKRDNAGAAISQAVMAVASHCTQQGYAHMRGCTTSDEQWIFFCPFSK